MATYFFRDVETDDEGEIQIQNGDFEIATTERTAIQLANWVMLTEFADYLPLPTFGANLGEYLGYPNVARTRLLMRQSARNAFIEQQYFDPTDIRLVVEPIDVNEAGVLLQLLGEFELEPDEETLGQIILAFRYPFPEGALTKASLGSE
jgi:hypothetical protein